MEGKGEEKEDAGQRKETATAQWRDRNIIPRTHRQRPRTYLVWQRCHFLSIYLIV